MFDLLLTGGSIVDGTGAATYVADIGIRDGNIAAIGDLEHADARERLDVAGLTVAPGFIDLHTHSDFTLLINGRGESQIHQGVTTEVVGQCGFSCAPVVSPRDVKQLSHGHYDGVVDHDWLSFGEYLDHLDNAPLGVNVAAFVGHGALHRAVLGDALRAPDADELKRMAHLLEASLEEGATGLSTGLEYWPGSLSSIEQIVPLCRVAARHDALYATHVRNRDLHYDMGFAEALGTARMSGVRLEISHIQPKFGAPDGAMAHTLSMIEETRSHDIEVGFDVIPHDWAHTTTVAILPQWAQEGGTPAILERLKDKKTRALLKNNPKPMWQLVPAERWEDIVLLYSRAHPELIGETFESIGRQRGVAPFDAVLDLMLEEGEGLGQLLWTSRSFSNEDIRMCLAEPECAVISDTLALAPYGALKDHIGSLSGYGWTARFIHQYVHEARLLTLEEAVRRMTSLPAARVRIRDRGRLAPGFKADIAVFDFDKVLSRCSVHNPRQYAQGFVHVLVNGQITLKDGRRTDVNTGTVIRSKN